MKITFVLPFINLTGGIRVLLDYANWLHGAGHDVVVVYPCWPYRFQYTRRQQWTEFQKHRRHDGRVGWYELRCPLLRAPVIATPFLPRADVVIAAGWAAAHDVARLHHTCGTKVQIVFHDETGTGPAPRIHAAYRLPFYRIAFSEFVRRAMQSEFACEVHDAVPNGVDARVFYRDGAPEERTVLWLYHPDPRKGADDGVDALARLRTRLPDVRVRVCGTVRPTRLPDWMPFEFHPDDATLRRRYSTATALLYPSRYEGFGLPPLEAMSCGCPPVTTRVGAVPEYAADGRDALIVQAGDVEAMADRLARLLNDAAMRQRLSEEGVRTARRFSLDAAAPLFAAALDRAASAVSRAG